MPARYQACGFVSLQGLSPPHLHRYEKSFPSLGLLDLGMCQISERELEAMLMDLQQVHTLILDGCPIVSQRLDALDVGRTEALSQWNELGKTLAMIGVKRARTKEKNIKSWIEKQEEVAAGLRAQGVRTTEKKKKSGRRGIANATISLRGAKDNPIGPGDLKPTAPLLPFLPSGGTKTKGKKEGQPTLPTKKDDSNVKVKPTKKDNSSVKVKPLQPSSSTLKVKRRPAALLKPTNFRMLPAPPSLRSLAVSAPMASVTKPGFKEKYGAIREAFESGWASGVRIMGDNRSRVKTSWWNGVVRVHVTDTKLNNKTQNEGDSGISDQEDAVGEVPESNSPSSSGSDSDSAARAHKRTYNAQLKRLFAGLRSAAVPEDFELDLASVECPILCLAGASKNDFHPSRMCTRSGLAVMGRCSHTEYCK